MLFAADMRIANKYYQQLNQFGDADTSARRFKFITIMGELIHHILPLLPLYRGTAATLEWFMRGVTFQKGIELGEFDFESTGLSWDIKALLTPNRHEYAQWFATKAFKSYVGVCWPKPKRYTF